MNPLILNLLKKIVSPDQMQPKEQENVDPETIAILIKLDEDARKSSYNQALLNLCDEDYINELCLSPRSQNQPVALITSLNQFKRVEFVVVNNNNANIFLCDRFPRGIDDMKNIIEKLSNRAKQLRDNDQDSSNNMQVEEPKAEHRSCNPFEETISTKSIEAEAYDIFMKNQNKAMFLINVVDDNKKKVKSIHLNSALLDILKWSKIDFQIKTLQNGLIEIFGGNRHHEGRQKIFQIILQIIMNKIDDRNNLDNQKINLELLQQDGIFLDVEARIKIIFKQKHFFIQIEIIEILGQQQPDINSQINNALQTIQKCNLKKEEIQFLSKYYPEKLNALKDYMKERSSEELIATEA